MPEPNRNEITYIDGEDARTAFLLAHYSTPRMEKIWAEEHEVTPRVLKYVIFGDGKLLLEFTPMATRPLYYIIRICSSWRDQIEKEREVGEKSEELILLLDSIQNEMESEYDDLREYNDGESAEAGDEPVGSSLDIGGSWDIIKSPEWDEFLKSQEVAE